MRAAQDGPRWVPPERWHLTLAFYGEVPDREVAKVVDRLDRRLGDVADLALALTGAGAFSRRAVWLGVTGDVAPLRAWPGWCARDRGRPYRPHLTVARLRGDADADTRRGCLVGVRRSAAGRPASCTWCARSWVRRRPTTTSRAGR